ncbi:ACP S-malonyltransferase [Lentzea sp. NPDC055074]
MSDGWGLVFPGMAPSNHAAVGEFMSRSPHARRRLAVADEVLGFRLVDALRDSRDDTSVAAQVSFAVNCLALADWAEEELGVEAVACAGPSFGQFAAAAYAGCLPFTELVRLVALVAEMENQYFREHHRDVVTHFFYRTPPDRLADLLARAVADNVWFELSSRFDDDFHAICLREQDVPWFRENVLAASGVPLHTLRPAVHCALFAGLRDRLAAEVYPKFHFTPPAIPLVSAQDGTVLSSADQVLGLLAGECVRPVDWPAAAAGLRAAGVTRVCVPGPSNLFDRLSAKHFEVHAAGPERAMPAGAVS